MMKTDKQSLSMANEALDHTVKLTVKKKKYTLTLSFSDLTINGQKGYLGWLKYYKDGYQTDAYGGPIGSPKAVDVTKKQNGTDYPKEISFTMIAEAKKDGYVPLQVFVPVMDAISAGSGIQNVYLKLDLENITQDQNKVKETEDNSNSGSGTQGSRTNGTIGSKTAASGNGSAGSSLGNQSLPVSSQTKGTSTLPSSYALKKTKDAAKSSKKQKDSEAAKEDAVLKNKIEDAAGQAASVSAESQQQEDSENGDTVTTGQGRSGAQSKKGNPVAAALPSLGALLAAGAGVLYKIRSRRWVL